MLAEWFWELFISWYFVPLEWFVAAATAEQPEEKNPHMRTSPDGGFSNTFHININWTAYVRR